MAIRQELNYLAEQKNIHLTGVKGFIENGSNKDGNGKTIPNNYAQIAMDAALVTAPNIHVPVQLLSYWDPKAIDVLTAKRSASEIFPEVRKGSFASQQIFFHQRENTGNTKPYSDFSESGMASVNYNFPSRGVYRMQTHIVLGDLESEMSGEAKINLLADKQRAAATAIAIDSNKYFLFGIAGRNIYGILNDPDLLPSIPPVTVDGKIKWADKTTQQRYNDVLALFGELATQLQGLADQESPITLAVSPSMNVMLGAATDFNVSVMDMLNKFFKRLKIVVVPELENAGTQTMFMVVDEVMGQRTGELLVPEKFRNYPVFRFHSSISQKVAAATAGAVVYNPAAIATMTGM